MNTLTSTPQQQLAFILVSLCDIIDDSLNPEGDGVDHGFLYSGAEVWNITGVAMARSRVQHGAERFGGVTDTEAALMATILRQTASSILRTPEQDPVALLNNQLSRFMPGVAARTLALGLTDEETEYSGNMILVTFPDLMDVSLCSQGRLNVVADGHKQSLELSFREHGLGALVDTYNRLATLMAARPPR